MRHVLDQPINGIPGVSAFIGNCRSGLRRFERTHLREFTFGLVSATHVLKGEDEFAAGVIPHGVFGIRISIRAIGPTL